jgi:hypothetical protein
MNSRAVLLLASLACGWASGCSSESPPVGVDSEVAALVLPPKRAIQEDSAPLSGFTLVSPLSSKRTHLIDLAGNEVHHWDSTEKSGESCYLTTRGTLLRCREIEKHPTFQDEGGHGGGIFEYGATGELLWEFLWDNEEGLQHHDIEELPNGNVLFVAWDRNTREFALAAGRDPELLEGAEWWSGAIYEVKPTRPKGGEIVWSWHSRDHLVQNYDRDLAGYGNPAEHIGRIDINGDRDPKPPTEEEKSALDAQMQAVGYAGGDDEPEDISQEEGEEEEELSPEEAAKKVADEARRARVRDADWTHFNAVAYNAELDQIAISCRRFDEIWIIDHGTTREEAKGPAGDLLYRFGNEYAYGMGQWRERRFLGQHNVQWIPKGYVGEGNLLVFNNGGARPRSWSTIVEWWAPRDENGRYVRMEGQPFGPSQYEWSYHADDVHSFEARFISGVQRLPNGNTLICDGPQGRVFEVTQEGEVVWDWQNDLEPFEPVEGDMETERFRQALFRAVRYATDSPEIEALRAAGAPIPISAGEAPPIEEPAEDSAGDSAEEPAEKPTKDD